MQLHIMDQEGLDTIRTTLLIGIELNDIPPVTNVVCFGYCFQ